MMTRTLGLIALCTHPWAGCGGGDGGEGEAEAEAEAEAEGEACVPVGGDWMAETVANVGNSGSGGPLAVDGDGVVHMSLVEGCPSTIRHAFRTTAGAWDAEDVDILTTCRWLVPIGVGPDGELHVVYEGSAIDGYRHAARTAGGTWTVETIDDTGLNVGGGASMVVDGDAGVHTSYYVSDVDVIKYGYLPSGGAWSLEEIADTGLSQDSRIGLDAAGNVHVAYLDTFGFTALNLATPPVGGGMWDIEPIFDGSENVDAPALAVSDAGDLHVAYHRWEVDVLEYATRGASTWSAEPVEPATEGRPAPALAVDETGVVHLAYYQGSASGPGEMRYTSSAADWAPESVDSVDGAGDSLAMRADHYGLHIGYMDLSTDDVKYAHKCP